CTCMRNQCLLAGDGLLQHLLATYHLAGDRPPQCVEGIAWCDCGCVRTQSPRYTAVLNHTQRWHVVGKVTVHLEHQTTLYSRSTVDLCVHIQAPHSFKILGPSLIKMRKGPAKASDRLLLVDGFHGRQKRFNAAA